MQIEYRHELGDFLQDCGIHGKNFVEEQIDSVTVLNDVLIEAGITGDQHGPAVELDAISDGGFGRAVMRKS